LIYYQFAYDLPCRSDSVTKIEQASNAAMILGALDGSIEDNLGNWLFNHQNQLIPAITGFYNFQKISNMLSVSGPTSAVIEEGQIAQKRPPTNIAISVRKSLFSYFKI
jgi:hypothetical protein